MTFLTAAIVACSGLYLLGLGILALGAPARTTRFLEAFASTASAHYFELLLRVVAGGAMVVHAPRMLLPGLWTTFGWMLVVTTCGLAAVPWRWHREFASRVIPRAVRHLALVAVPSLLLGGLILTALFRGGR